MGGTDGRRAVGASQEEDRVLSLACPRCSVPSGP